MPLRAMASRCHLAADVLGESDIDELLGTNGILSVWLAARSRRFAGMKLIAIAAAIATTEIVLQKYVTCAGLDVTLDTAPKCAAASPLF